MSELSPAALTVWSAFSDHYEWEVTQTELCAAVDQVVPDDYDPPRGVSYPEKDAFVDGKCVRNEDIRFQLLAIATELDNL